MKSLPCEHESEIARAARTGFWSGDLRQHAEACSTCAETLAVTAALLEDSAHIRATQPPEAAHVWLEVRRRARLHLRHRALFWFRALRILALVYLPGILIWTVSSHASAVREPWKPSFREDFTSLLTGPAEIFALSGALLAALCVFAGSWYLLREARTPLHHSPSH
jgi:hypothetical protein